MKFAEAQLDGAAALAAHGAIEGLPDEFLSFLTDSQLAGLQNDIRDFVKTSLMFDLMTTLSRSMTEYYIIGESGERIAGGLASIQHALHIAQLYGAALKIYRVEPVLACVKDVETGLWCAPDE